MSFAYAQDIGVTAINAPASGCNLSSTESVTIKIFNYGSNVVTPFNVSYTINGGPAVTEVINAMILSNSTYTYTFATTADLSAGGTFTFTAYTSLAGDINPTNDALNNYNVNASAPSAGGTVTGGTFVCTGANSGSVTLTGYTGDILRWEYSTDNGNTWINISNTSNTQSYLNLTVKTFYRAVTQNGVCPPSTSTPDSIRINTASVGGSVGTSATVCSGANGAVLSLTGATGTVQYWQYSTNGGSTWTNIVNTGNTQPYSNLTTTTRYRAVVKNGACNAVNSNFANIAVSPPTVKGYITGSDTVCSSSNSGSLILSGHVGSVLRWEYSLNQTAWTNINNTTNTQAYSNLSANRYYRALIKSGGCASVYSDTARMVVDQPTVPGSVTGGSTVCEGSTGTLTLTGTTSPVQNWEASTDGGNSWLIISNTSSSYTYNNITTTTMFRALVKSGNCAAIYSSSTTVVVDAQSSGGTVASGSTVCSASNGATLTLSGIAGTIQGWVSSTDNGVTWTSIPNTTNAYTYSNLTTSTLFGAVVKNGVCPEDTSVLASIVVDAPSVGGAVSGSASACSNVNNGVLTLTGETGTIQGWEYSTDGGFTWLPIANTTNSQSYNNLTVSTKYRVLVQSGVCPPAYSSAATISIDQQSQGGNVFGATTVCAAGNSGSLNLLNNQGSVVDWEFSSDGGATWNSTAVASITYAYTNLTGTTIFRAIVQNGVCPSDTSASATVTVDSVSLGGIVQFNDTVCYGNNNGTLNLSGYRGTVTAWEVSTDNGTTWFFTSNTTTSQGYLNLSTTTSYRATLKNGVCPVASSTPATITVLGSSVAGVITGITQGCSGAVSGTLSTNGNIGSILDWQTSVDNGTTWTNAGNPSATMIYQNLTTTTLYKVIIQNGACSSDTSASVAVTVYPNPVASFTADTVCAGNANTFVNGSSVASGSIQMNQWNFGDNSTSIMQSPVHQYMNADNYTATLITITDKGCSDTTSATVIVNALPSSMISVTGANPFCRGGQVTLSAPSGTLSYMWSDGSVAQSINVNASGTFTVIVTDTLTNCISSDSVMTSVFQEAVADAGRDTTIALGDQITLEGSGGVMYQWTPSESLDMASSSHPVASPLQTTTYQLSVTDENGCSDLDSLVITVIRDYTFTVSNLITPNGDGFNDTWYIENIDHYPDSKVMIFNRNGQVIFTAEPYKNDWDATYEGSRVNDGSYYYVITFTGSTDVFKGTITVLTEETTN